MIQSFSHNTMEALKYYVYVYSDPDTKVPFYVGKGKGNRVFNHLKNQPKNKESENEKEQKIKEITSKSIKELKEKVTGKDLKWEIIDEEKAKMIMQKEDSYINKNFGNTGINHLYKFNCSNCKQGFIYEYRYPAKTEGMNKIQSTNLNTIKEKVIEKGLKWEITDESLASKTINDFKEIFEEKSVPGNTNYYRVYKKSANGKPYYRYRYSKNGKQETIGSISIKELERKVKAKGLKWEKIDETMPDIKDNPTKTNKSGIYRVSKQKCKSCAKGYRWRYTYKQNSKRKEITANSLKELKQKTLERNLEWRITDKNKAKKSWELDKT